MNCLNVLQRCRSLKLQKIGALGMSFYTPYFNDLVFHEIRRIYCSSKISGKKCISPRRGASALPQSIFEKKKKISQKKNSYFYP